jgi:hypothetical protein
MEYREVKPVEKRKTFYRKVKAVSAKQETANFSVGVNSLFFDMFVSVVLARWRRRLNLFCVSLVSAV